MKKFQDTLWYNSGNFFISNICLKNMSLFSLFGLHLCGQVKRVYTKKIETCYPCTCRRDHAFLWTEPVLRLELQMGWLGFFCTYSPRAMFISGGKNSPVFAFLWNLILRFSHSFCLIKVSNTFFGFFLLRRAWWEEKFDF